MWKQRRQSFAVNSVDQIYKVKMADLQGHLQEILSRTLIAPALFHLALLQVSSVCVERVFSQVTLICDTCGVNQSMLATRVMERVDKYKID
jgi:transcription elongation factor Elf1